MPAERLTAWGEELRRVHQRLRESLRIARQAVAGTADGTDVSATRDLLLYCRGFCVAITGHHQGEGAAMFPRIVADRPDLAPVIDELIRDHNMIDHLVGELDRVLESGAGEDELNRHLDGIEAVMETHFRYEERKLIDVLNAVRDEDLDATELFGAIA